MNKVFLRGNLVKDVELKHSSNNNAMCNFSIAVRRNTKNQQGEYECDFINCVAYMKLAETIEKYFKKGSGIIIEGHIQTGSYTGKDGNKVYSTNVIVERIEFDGKPSVKKEETKSIEEKKENDGEDPFASFGEKIQIDDNDLPF